MADENIEDTSLPSSHPYFVHGGFPFVFLPSTGFTFANNHTHVSPSDNQTTTEFKKKQENKKEIEVEDEEGTETIDDDEADRTEENDEDTNEKSDLRISQPKYSQLLKELDFSQSRMVDVTNLLSNELDEQENYLSPEENESPKKHIVDNQYEDSSVSSDEISNNNQTKENNNLQNAANDVQNDLNNLAAIIQEPSQISTDKNNDIHRKHTFDEDDDTSRQATQNYDLHDNEQEDIPSSKSSRIPRLINQHSNGIRNENKYTQRKIPNQTKKQEENKDEKQQPPITWENLIHGTDPNVQPVIESHFTPQKQPFASSEEKSKPQTNSSIKQKLHQKFHRVTSSSSSSSDTDSVVEHVLHRSNEVPLRQPTPPIIPSQTIRQDSQATLIDENLDDLSSQLKQVFIDQERQTVNTDTKEERTVDGLASMSFPLSTPDILSTNIIDNNQPTDHLLRRLSNQRIDYNQYASDIPERSTSNRNKSNYHQQQRYSASRNDGINSRKTDDHWLTMLEQLECEHRTRLEQRQQQYEDYMHTLEEKMKRRFDDYLTLTNGFQESRLDNHGDTMHIHRTHTSIPIDSNIGRYKNHSHTHQYRSLAKDLVSHHYPADSTLNILTTEKKRSTISNDLPRSSSREDLANLRTELSAKHAKHIADLKLYYEYEINELKSQLNRTRMGHTSSSTRQSMETIERMNNENVRLHDEVNDLRHSLKITEDENSLLKRQLEELREQLNTKDLDLKNYHRTISDLEQQLTETENERLLRLEERYREQENENEVLRRQIFMLENESNRLQNRMTDDHKLSSTMPMNIPTSREYGRFTLTTTPKTSSSSRDGNINSERYQTSNKNENLFRHTHSPRPITRITDYLNERPVFPQPYIPPTRHVYSPKKSSPTRRRVEPMSTRHSADRQTRQSEQLEQKFDQLLKKKRDLETRINRIPIRGLTNTDRQLYDVLQREIDRVEQQISNVKLELRKLNILRTH